MIDDKVKAWLTRFWFLRGVLAALVVLAPVAAALDISRYEFLRFTHAVFVGWDKIAGWLGGVIGLVPFIPHLSAIHVNALIFFLSVGAPAAMAVIAYAAGEGLSFKKISSKNLIDKYNVINFYVMLPITISILLPNIYTLMAENDSGLLYHLVFTTLLVALAAFCILFLPGYGKGVFLFFSFLATFQILYFLPIVGDIITRFTDAVLSSNDALVP